MRPIDTRTRSRLEDVYRAEAKKLWRALFLQTGDRERASDAVSEAFAQALRRGDELDNPAGWIWSVAFRIARATHTREQLEADPVGSVEPSLPDDLIDLVSALSKLSPMQRSAAVLHYYGGYTLQEVAEILGSTRSAIGVHLFRARQRLRQELGGEDG